MKKKTRKNTKKTTKKTVKAERIKQAFNDKKQAITVLVPGKFHFGVARIQDEKKIVVCAKFVSAFDAAKFCDMLNK